MKFILSNCKYLILFAFLTAVPQLPAAGEKKETANYFLAGIIDEKNISTPSEREKQLIALLDALTATSSTLAVESSDLAKEFEQLISESGINPARAAALRLKAQSVTRLAGKVALMTENTPENAKKTLKKCRILAVNKELGIVVIEAGAIHGVFKGMVFNTLPGEAPAELRVSVTRPEVSGAVVIKGSINQLGPGMGVTAVERKGAM